MKCTKNINLVAYLSLFLIVTYVFGSPLIAQAVGSFGITPPYVINYELEPADVYEQRIFIVRRNPDKDLQATIRWDVPGADTWLTIDRGQSFTLPAGEQRVPMMVQVLVPRDARAGEYTGLLEVEVHGPEEQTQSGMIAVGLELTAQVELHVLSDGVVEESPSDQVAGVFFAGLMSGWIWSGLALLLLLFLVLLLRGKWLWRKIRKTQEA